MALTIILRGYGLNSHAQPDESYEVRRALNVLEGEYQWERITKGGIYIILTPIYYVASFLTDDYNNFLFLGRVAQVAIGALLIWFVFSNSRILYGRKWALFFIIPAVFCIQLIYNSHHVNVQNLMFLCVVMHLYLVTKFLKKKDLRLLGTSLIPLSIATASQISAAIILLPFLFLFVIQYIQLNSESKNQLIRAVLKYGLISIGIYVLMTPGIIIYFGDTVKSVLHNMVLISVQQAPESSVAGYATQKNLNYWIEYERYILNFFGKFNILLLLISVVVLFMRKKWILLYPLSIFVLFYIVFTNASQTTYGGRYIIPGLLAGYIIMPMAVVQFSDWLKPYKKNIRYLILWSILVIISINFSRIAFYCWQGVKQYSLPDTRDIVSQWLAKNITREDRILLEGTCYFPKVPYKEQAVYIDNCNVYPESDEVKVNYIIINKSSIDYLYSKKVKSSYQSLFKELSSSKNWNVIYTEKAVKDKITGPEIQIYKRTR